MLFSSNLFAQKSDIITIKHIDSESGIKNVNIFIPKLDTILITNAEGIVDLSGLYGIDTLIVRKFGYKQQIITNSQRQVFLRKNSLAYSHNLKVLDLKFIDGSSIIELSINGEIYQFKQNSGPLYLLNGRELEDGKEYEEVFKNHKIIKTVSIASEYCLFGYIGRNEAPHITAIYYNPMIKKKKSTYIPLTSWSTKRKMKKDSKILKLENNCL